MSKREFDIAFVGLKLGMHEFEYQVNDKFFEEHKDISFWNCDAKILLKLEKNNKFFILKFEIGGTVVVNCDRCGNDKTVNLWEDFDVVVKMVDNPQESNDTEEDANIFYISVNESHLHLQDWIHDFVMLSVPNQNKCEDDEINGQTCNLEVLKKLEKISISTAQQSKNDLWKGLDKIKFDN